MEMLGFRTISKNSLMILNCFTRGQLVMPVDCGLTEPEIKKVISGLYKAKLIKGHSITNSGRRIPYELTKSGHELLKRYREELK